MSLESRLKTKIEKKSLLLMTHMVVGYPSLEANRDMLQIMKDQGADIVELQFPFSEPVADGPTFVQANQESLDRGTKIQDGFDLMKEASAQHNMEFLMMGYYNTIYQIGDEAFCQKLKEAGGCGLIVPDLPPEKAASLIEACEKYDLSFVILLTPNSSEKRLQEVLQYAKGMVYCVARKGVTGLQTRFSDDVSDFIHRVRQNTSLPLALGFGVKDREDFEFLRGKADIAIVGTAALEAWKNGEKQGLQDLLASFDCSG